MMWTKQTLDPLGKLLFQRHSIHMLSRPRRNVSVFDVFPVRDGAAQPPGSIDTLLRSALARPEVERDEPTLDIDTTMSDAVEGKVGVSFLQGFLSMIGLGGAANISASLEKSKSRALRFQFGGCTRDYIKDGFALELALNEHPFDPKKSAMKDGYRYYIATAVHFCKSLTFEVLDQNLSKVNMEAEVMALGGANAGLSVNRERQITARSDQTLAYGVELSELFYDEQFQQLGLKETGAFLPVRGGGAGVPGAEIVAPDEPRVLRIED